MNSNDHAWSQDWLLSTAFLTDDRNDTPSERASDTPRDAPHSEQMFEAALTFIHILMFSTSTYTPPLPLYTILFLDIPPFCSKRESAREVGCWIDGISSKRQNNGCRIMYPCIIVRRALRGCYWYEHWRYNDGEIVFRLRWSIFELQLLEIRGIYISTSTRPKKTGYPIYPLSSLQTLVSNAYFFLSLFFFSFT